MHVLFLEIDTQSQWAVASLGPAFIAAYIRRSGHEASLLRISHGMPTQQIVDVIRKRNPGLIGVSLTTRQWQDGRRILADLRQHIDTPVVVGGLHPTFSPVETLRQTGIDYVCLGEGEQAMLDLVEALEVGGPVGEHQIKNIWIKGGARPPLRMPFDPIDELPFMARDMLDEQHGVVHMATQRGCPFPCTYCAARMYDELYDAAGGNYGRRRSHESVLDELMMIRKEGQLNYVIYLDDTFTIHHPWVKAFCKLYRQQLRVPFSLHARVETVNERIIHELADAGCKHITYGVESGSERVRREIMKRPVTNEKIMQVFRWTKEAGMLATANYMIGIPGETRENLQQTLNIQEQLQPDDFGYFVFYPYPGTPLFKVCLDNGYLPANYLDLPANHRESILSLPGLTKADIAECYDQWTKVRIQHTLDRYGSNYATEDQQLTTELIEQCASVG